MRFVGSCVNRLRCQEDGLMGKELATLSGSLGWDRWSRGRIDIKNMFDHQAS